MSEARKPRRRPLGFFDAQDRVFGLNAIYRTAAFGSDRAEKMAQRHHEELSDVALPEPDEELEDSELGEGERYAAIQRERARRAGLI